MKRPPGRRRLVFLPIFLLAGAVMMGTGTYYIHKDLATPWEVVEGTVLHSEVVTHRSSDSTTWSPLIEYNYTYRGQEYRGVHQPGFSSSDLAGAQRLVDDHPPGRRVEVKVNPTHPRESGLRLGFVAENLGWLVLAGVGSLFALPSAWALARALRRSTPESGVPGPAGLPEFGTSRGAVECPSCHQLVEPLRKWRGRAKCPRCGAKLG